MNGVYYIGIKEFNQLPSYIKKLLDNKNQLKILKKLPFIEFFLFVEGVF
jgi:hypothetical protein